MAQVLAHTQLVYLDLKHMDPAQHQKLTGAGNELILANAQRILHLADEGRLEVIVRCTCVPGCNDSTENIAHVAEFLTRSKVDHLELLPYHELGMPKYAVLDRAYGLENLQVDQDHLQRLVQVVRSDGLECRIRRHGSLWLACPRSSQQRARRDCSLAERAMHELWGRAPTTSCAPLAGQSRSCAPSSGMAQAMQGLLFDLPDAFTGQAVLSARSLRAYACVHLQAKAQGARCGPGAA